MVRWQPDARERLQKAALELFATRGFDDTTVADIAAAADLTERTFYRYFADKREVLFGVQTEFQQLFVDAIEAVPPGIPPLDVVAAAVAAICSPTGMFREERRQHSRLRQTVITAHPELMERELLKMAALAGVLAGALRSRGIDEPAASLAAESGVLVFRLAFQQWLAGDQTRTIADIEADVFASLRALSA